MLRFRALWGSVLFLAMACDSPPASPGTNVETPKPAASPEAQADQAPPVATPPAEGDKKPLPPASELPPGPPSEVPAGTPAAGDRAPAIPASHPMYNRFEGTHVNNACTSDSECVKGGCSSEVCSADKSVNTTCEVIEGLPEGASCGCVAKTCIWVKGSGGSTPAPPKPPTDKLSTKTAKPKPTPKPTPKPKAGVACGKKTCAQGEQCLEYYGIAGPKGPKLKTCGIPCGGKKGKCPSGKRCVTMSDGAGSVCQ